MIVDARGEIGDHGRKLKTPTAPRQGGMSRRPASPSTCEVRRIIFPRFASCQSGRRLDAEHNQSQGQSGRAQFCVETRKRKQPSKSQLEIGRILHRQIEGAGQGDRVRPSAVDCRRLDFDRKLSKITQRKFEICELYAPAPDSHLQRVRDFQGPQRCRHGPARRDTIQNGIRGGPAFIHEPPTQRDRRVEDAAQCRPSSMRSRKAMLPSVALRL